MHNNTHLSKTNKRQEREGNKHNCVLFENVKRLGYLIETIERLKAKKHRYGVTEYDIFQKQPYGIEELYVNNWKGTACNKDKK